MKNITTKITKICTGIIFFLAFFGIGFGAAQSLILNSQSRSTRRSVPFPSFAGIGLSLPPNLSGFPELSSYPANPFSAIELDIFRDPAPLPQSQGDRDSVPPIPLPETTPGSLQDPVPVRQAQGRHTHHFHWTDAEKRTVVEAILDANTSRTPIRQLARQLAQSLPNHTAGTIRNHIDLIKKVLAENPELLAWLNDPALQENAIEILWQMTKAWIKKMREARATKPKKTRTTKEPDVLEVNAPDDARNGQPWDPEEDVRLIQTLCFFKHNGNDIREQQAILCREFNRNFEEIKNHGRALFQASLSLFGKGIWQYLKSHCTPTLPWKQAVERVFMNPPPNPEDFNGPQGMNAIRYFNQNWDETGGVISTIELLQKEIARQRAESNQPVQVAD